MSLAVSIAVADPDDIAAGAVEPLNAAGIALGTLGGVEVVAPVILGYIGDFGVGSEDEEKVANLVKSWSPTAIITGGDNNYGDLESQPNDGPTAWSQYIGAYYGDYIKGRTDNLYPDQQSPIQRFFPAVGNHDSDPAGSTGGIITHYLNYFHRDPSGLGRLPTDRGAVHNDDVSYYAVTLGPVDVFVLDSDAIHVPNFAAMTEQRAWLAARLAESTASWQIAVFHHSPYTSVRPGEHPWMLWPELMDVDAIFCAHDHVYERLVMNDETGPPIFIGGNSGAGLYDFQTELPQSITQYNATHGALKLAASTSSFAVEAWGFDDENTPIRIEATDVAPRGKIGTGPGDSEDIYSFYAETGMEVSLSTTTLPPLSQPPLDPALSLHAVPGVEVASNSNGANDGRNARLSVDIPFPGQWQVKVRSEGPGSGQYLLKADFAYPTLSYWHAWALAYLGSSAVSASNADPDADGLPNVLEFALGTDPQLPDAEPLSADTPDGDWMKLSFDVPIPMPAELVLQVEASSDLTGKTWIPVAWKEPLRDWTGPVDVGSITGLDKRQVIIQVPVGKDSPRKFYRMRAILNAAP